jgi:hypothetical protein
MHHRPAFALCGARQDGVPTAAVSEAVRAIRLTSVTTKYSLLHPQGVRLWNPYFTRSTREHFSDGAGGSSQPSG